MLVILVSIRFHFELKLLKANSEEPDQTPHSEASDLGVLVCHCPIIRDAILLQLYGLKYQATVKLK